jgi:hypothetical protein
MTKEQKEQLNEIAKQLGGKIEYCLCSTLHTRHKKIVIIYDTEQK